MLVLWQCVQECLCSSVNTHVRVQSVTDTGAHVSSASTLHVLPRPARSKFSTKSVDCAHFSSTATQDTNKAPAVFKARSAGVNSETKNRSAHFSTPMPLTLVDTTHSVEEHRRQDRTKTCGCWCGVVDVAFHSQADLNSTGGLTPGSPPGVSATPLPLCLTRGAQKKKETRWPKKLWKWCLGVQS